MAGSHEGVELRAVAGGTRLRLRVKPAAKRNAVVGVHGGALKVAVAAPPEHGRANEAVVALLAETLGVAPSAVTIVAGETSRDKTVVISMPVDGVRGRLGG